MEKFLFLAFIIALLYCLGKFAFSKFVEKEMPPLKVIVRDTVIVATAAVVGLIGASKVESIWTAAAILPGSVAAPQIFTDEPGF
jgi:Na+-transporting methylmalonyl-CoA/oxaloacetate decarboxylase gamma subunit